MIHSPFIAIKDSLFLDKTIRMRYLLIFLFLFCANISNKSFGSTKAATEVVKGVLYSNNNQNFLILHELVYHATNKSYVKGNYSGVGYNNMRLSIYDLATGKLVNQKDMGTLDKDNAFVLLGCVDDNILLYSTYKNHGMYALNMHDLEEKVLFTNFMINRDFGSKMYKTDWRSLYQYFGYNQFTNEVIFTDSLKNKYASNLNKYNIKPCHHKLSLRKRSDYLAWETDLLSNKISFSNGNEQCITVNGTKTKPSRCFIDGYYLMENNLIRQFNFLFSQKEKCADERMHNAEKTEILKKANNDYYKLTQSKVDSIDVVIAKNKYQIENLLKGKPSTEFLIQPDNSSFFIVHKENEDADALLTISKIEVENNTIFFKPWSTSTQGMYYNLQKASTTENFKRYFPLGIPGSDYTQFEIVDDKLLVIYLLQMCLIDIQTGTILWKTRL